MWLAESSLLGSPAHLFVDALPIVQIIQKA